MCAALIDQSGLLTYLRTTFRCNWYGLHGVAHWKRVAGYGLVLGQIYRLPKEDLLIIQLFSYLHDSCRQNEEDDIKHGERGAVLARDLNGLYYDLNHHRLNKLCFAIARHSFGLMSSDITTQTCWDADRLDLVRVGITPDPQYLSKTASRLINNAIGRDNPEVTVC